MKTTILMLFAMLTTLAAHTQTIRGTVTNTQGRPIANALVCHRDNPTTFTKTARDGSYTISGNSNTRLRVAALRFETIPNYKVSSTSAANIRLAPDPLLNTDVFHISFDHLRAGNRYTKNELKADFDLSYSKGVYDGRAQTDRTSVDYNESRDPNGVSLKVRFPKRKLKTDDSGIDTRIDLEGNFKSNTFQSEDLYLSYWVKFSDNFEFDKCGGKLPSLGGSTVNSREDRWKGRIMWRKGGSIQFYMELPDHRFNASNDERFWGEQIKNGKGVCDFEYTPFLSSPGWHNIELHYKFETPGQNDGIFEGWVDGANFNVMDASVFDNYRPAGTTRENITINTIVLSAFLGGSDIDDYGPTEDTFAWFDEFRVSKTRINAWRTYNKSKALKHKTIKPLPFVVTPNPSTNGIFNLSTASPWEVYNLLGIAIAKGQGTTVDLSAASGGTYILHAATHTQKLIIP
jgi:hypothetical protein